MDYWDALQLLQECELYVESDDSNDVAYAAETMDQIGYIFDNLGSHLDLTIPRQRLKALRRKVERYFGD